MSTRSRSVTARRTFWCAVESGRFVRVVLVIFVCSPNTSRVLAGRTRRFSSPWLIRALVSAFLLHLVVSHASKIFAFPTTTVDAYSANEVSIDETIRSHPLFLFFLSSKDVPFIAFPFAGPFVDLLIYQVTSSGATTYRFFFKFGGRKRLDVARVVLVVSFCLNLDATGEPVGSAVEWKKKVSSFNTSVI